MSSRKILEYFMFSGLSVLSFFLFDRNLFNALTNSFTTIVVMTVTIVIAITAAMWLIDNSPIVGMLKEISIRFLTSKHLYPVQRMVYKCLLDYAASAGTVYIKGIVLQRLFCFE